MLFNSYPFIFVLLPITLLVFHAGRRSLPLPALLFSLLLASLFFYGYWNPVYLGLLIPSMLVNYALGQAIAGRPPSPRHRRWLILGVTSNLALLGYFKYRNFFLATWNDVFGSDIAITPLVLPLAISFFTFQQIAYLVDVYRQRTLPGGLVGYMTFVSFFPQLIAGPIVRYQPMRRQFSAAAWRRFDTRLFAAGCALFAVGLFKKVVLADHLALFATPVFDAAAASEAVTTAQAAVATFGYGFQLYFDFSGYADMALGLAGMFGLRLPINFDSPYRARSLVDFWQRWHMTLSRFLRDYLYIPLGGNRRGELRRYVNLMATMLLGGLWHGAGWTFLAWGGLHGLMLTLNHLWRRFTTPRRIGLPAPVAILATFVLVSLAWVLFRADSFDAARQLYAALLQPSGSTFAFEESRRQMSLEAVLDLHPATAWLWLAGSAAIVFFLPNGVRWLGLHPDQQGGPGRSRLAFWKGLLAGVLLFVALNRLSGGAPSEFLYFDF